jgi:hypothetical protein
MSPPTRSGRPLAGTATQDIATASSPRLPDPYDDVPAVRAGGRAHGIYPRLPFLRGRRDRARQLARVTAEARQAARDRRRRVLAHPDLARRLALEMGYTRPEAWSGYIPPATIPAAHGPVTNTSPRRAALIAVLYAVAERDARTDRIARDRTS